ncbi:FmdB family zinc ribbon protein [Mycetocola zhujimingii]|uniref:FmdB family transcriptional regulator n=1 Tax=Mycetocola zhujimingii TaxID=2079792 RepID=A0A2U1TDF6_9MICO|nr:FmdB family zinc ribbon protein [Mycetocola zhujimingii]PWC06909.1 FmdB family transcriptional regulator [Mycetocola zhujimingii]
MPTYSYKCTVCDTAFDIQQSFTDDSLTECPECAGRLRKLYSAVGVSFTGSGFYRNDSRAPAARESSGSGSSSGKKNGAGSKDSPGPTKEKVSSSPASGSAGSSSAGSTATAS